ncbi:MAG: dienelactone hydrolase family protein [Bosea sp. (in: a-proteobacteria)]
MSVAGKINGKQGLRALALAALVLCAGLIGVSPRAWATGIDTTHFRFERVTLPVEGGALHGVLYRPDGPGPFPAVIALHGCGGLFNKQDLPSARHADWGRRLAAQGFMVLLPDSFGSRGLGSQCGVTDRTVRASKERVGDAHAARRWLQARSDVKAAAISLLGWSNGGSTVLTAMRADKALADGQPDFAGAVAFYPGCRGSYESASYRVRRPLLILMGSEDDWTPLGPCEGLVTAARARGEPAEIVVYKGAVHDFDHPNLTPRERDGLAFSAGGEGKARVGTDPEARADALVRVPKFLAR